MRVRSKRIFVLLLVLFIQIQPLQVHAIVLDAEQSGHTAGQVRHAHNESVGHANTSTDSVIAEQQLDCHPSHTPLPLPHCHVDSMNIGQSRYFEHSLIFLSADLSLDTPPPKAHPG